MTFTHDEYVLAILQLGFTAEQYLEAILGLEAEFAFERVPISTRGRAL